MNGNVYIIMKSEIICRESGGRKDGSTMKMKLHRSDLFKRVISFAVAFVMLLSFLPVTPHVHAADAGTKLYLKPNANWKNDGARFAIYYWNDGGSAWTGMADSNNDGVYEGIIPAGYTNVIFCRMNPGNATNNWDNKWNQTSDLSVPTNGNNCYTVKDGTWNNGGGTWSHVHVYNAVVTAPTCTAEGYTTYTCGCGDSYVGDEVAASGHTYADGVCTVCGADEVYTVYFQNNWLWSDVRAYYWGSSGTNPGWPGIAMEKVDVVDGYDLYAIELPVDVTGLIFNGLKDDGSGNRDQTPDITIALEDGLAFYMVWDDGNKYGTFMYTTEEEEPTEPEEPAGVVTVHYQNASNWAKVYGYVWESTGSNNSWPGIVLAENTANAGWLDLVVTDTDGAFSCIFNNGSGTQTADIAVDHSDGTTEFWFAGNKLTKTAPDGWTEGGTATPDETDLEYFLYGWIDGADVIADTNKFVDGKLNITFTASDNYVFVKNSNGVGYMTNGWLGQGVTSAVLGTSYTNGDKLHVPAGEYEFSLVDNGDGTLTLSYTKVGAEEPAEVDYYLAGYINGNDVGIEADSANFGDYKFVDGKVSVTLTETSYVVVKDSSGVQYWAETYCTDTTVTLKAGAGEKMMVPAGEQTFSLVVNADGTLTLSYSQVIDTPEIPEGYNTVTIHFLKPATWGSTVNAWIWDDAGAIPGYEEFQTAWPGSPIPANADKAGWYDITVATAEPQAFNFIFNDGSSQTPDLTTGEIEGPTELWVVGENVYTAAPREWTHFTATIHFQKPADWGDTVSAYAWNENGNLMGEWPGTVAPASVNAGWHTAIIHVEAGKSLNFIFNNNNNGKQTADLTAGVLTGNIELWINGSGNQVAAPDGWIDAARTVHLPGTLPGPSWDAASNEMTYDAVRGLYTITFEDVTPGTYYYKIAINGGWGENYGANGEPNGDNMSVNVPVKQDVTFWYSDSTHRVVCSVNYDIDALVSLTGSGLDEKLTDPELDGIYSVTVKLAAGTYSDLKITHGEYEVAFNEFNLSAEKNVTFNYDPSTGMAYHNGSDVKVDTTNIYYTTKDLDYKDPFGAVATGEEVTFAITTGTDATGVALAIRGLGAVKLEKDGEAVDGVQRWVGKTTFDRIGEYQYYFAITNGSDMVFYCDDNWNSYYKKGDYGEGGIGNPDDIFAYDLVVYEAGFETPDWMKNAVIYQIFPDRFFDGNEDNNVAQTWARGTVDYEYVTDWYLLPENPEMTGEANYPTYAFKGDGEWSNEIYGGDLKGIVEKIDYLKALGVNVIYLNPVFWSISNHRYDAVSYSEIDPILGTLGDFEELVAVAEANGMHIILDGVFNHVSDDSVYFDRYYKFLPDAAEKYEGKIGAYPYWAYVYDYMNDYGVAQAEAEAAAKAFFGENYGITDYSYTEWFAVQNKTTASKDTIGLRAGMNVYSYEGWWGYDSMPVIYSTNGSEYQTGNWAEEIIDGENSVNAYWISKGMDGWRLDVANEVSDETWQNFRDSVKALDSEAVIIGEIWADATYYLMGDMYDSVMNYVFRDAVAGFARGYLINRDNKAEKYDANLTADEAMTILEILRERYPEEAFYAMMNLVASHDTSRILSYLDDLEDDRYQKDMDHAFPTYEKTSDRAKQLQYVVSFLQFTYAGAPTIYYGDEIGMVGGDDPDDRRAFTWGKGNREIVEWYAELAAIRSQYPALRTGSVEAFSTGNDDVMGFVRADAANTVVVMANRAASAKTISYEGTWVDLISGETFTDSVEIPAYRGVILVAADEVKTASVNYADLAPAYDPAYTVEARCAHVYEDGYCTVCGDAQTAESGKCGDNLYWAFDVTTGILKIHGTGDMYNYGYDSDAAPWDAFKARILRVEMEEGATSVGNWAFTRCENMTELKLASTVKSIGHYAFYACYGLTELALPDGLLIINDNAFNFCTGLKSVVIPDSVTVLGGNSFTMCSSLESVVIGSGVESIGWTAFGYDYNLTSVIIKEGVQRIESEAFMACDSLTEIVIPSSVKIIETYVFAHCYGLTSITFAGDAPEFLPSEAETENGTILEENIAFYEVVATAYYPAGNETWTEEVMQNYGGTITWVSYCAEHSMVTENAVEATCTEPGYTGDAVCQYCGYTESGEEIPAHGHNVVLQESEAPACELNGFEYYACEHCGGEEYTIILEATGHNYEDGSCTGCGQEDPNADKPSKPGIGNIIGNLIGKWFDKWFGDNDQPTTPPAEPEQPTTPPTEPEKPQKPNKPGFGSIFDWFFWW